jgi:hypothetical protein
MGPMVAFRSRAPLAFWGLAVAVIACGCSGTSAGRGDGAADGGTDRHLDGPARADDGPAAAKDAPAADRPPDGSPSTSDLQGSWYADLPAPDGGSPRHERLRFSGTTYYFVSNDSTLYCGETGTFEISGPQIAFHPTRAAGFGSCPSGSDRSLSITWTASGFSVQEAASLASYRRSPAVPKVFVTFETHNGDLADDTSLPGSNAVERADAICNGSLAKPDEATYQALLIDGVYRTALPPRDWVLAPNTTYYQPQGVVNVFTTDTLAISHYDTNHPILEDYLADPYFWTGIGFDFLGTSSCQGWTSDASKLLATTITPSAPQAFVSSVSGSCDTSNGFVCVTAPPPASGAGSDAGAPDAGLSALEGSWFNETPVSATVPGMTSRLKFTGGQYAWVQENGTEYCGEVGAFAAETASVHFRPARVEGYGPCTIGPERIASLSSDSSGITLSYGGQASHFAPAAAVPKLFVTFESHNGDFLHDDSLAGTTVAQKADAFCARSSAKPDTRTYKAALTDGVSRSASPAIDWVLQPNTTYYHASGMDRLFETNPSGTFTLNYGPAILMFSSFWYQWTGFDETFATTTQTCQGWTSTDPTLLGTMTDASHNPPLYAAVTGNCNGVSSSIVCASQ